MCSATGVFPIPIHQGKLTNASNPVQVRPLRLKRISLVAKGLWRLDSPILQEFFTKCRGIWGIPLRSPAKRLNNTLGVSEVGAFNHRFSNTAGFSSQLQNKML